MDYKLCATLSGECPHLLIFFPQLEKVAFTRPQKRLARFLARHLKAAAKTEQKKVREVA